LVFITYNLTGYLKEFYLAICDQYVEVLVAMPQGKDRTTAFSSIKVLLQTVIA